MLHFKKPTAGEHLITADDCSTIREKDKCLALAGCTYCQNKYSPMPGSDGVCLSAEQAKLLPKMGYKCQSGAPQEQQQQQQQQQHMEASAGRQAPHGKQPSGGGDNCGKLREKKQCLKGASACVWCQNKYSPWPGSDGVCTSPDQAQYLPDSTYKCSKPPPAQHTAAAAGAAAVAAQAAMASSVEPAPHGKQPSGGGDNCGKLHEKKQCLHADACVWCQNKYSPWPGSDGVCTSPDQAQYLPDSTYKCSKPRPAQHAAATAAAATAGPAQPAAAAAAAGSAKPGQPGKSCSSVHVEKQCVKQRGCIWCQNMFSPMPGSDGVCIEPDYKKQLPKWTYKCSDDAQGSKGQQARTAAPVAAA
ncbi:hypothetical protein OEZ86_013855 [Tetradesmus obliquus]|nr:hypothetical protein OEZ86_013855 [Tetradesmus obliquus]